MSRQAELEAPSDNGDGFPESAAEMTFSIGSLPALPGTPPPGGEAALAFRGTPLSELVLEDWNGCYCEYFIG